MRKSKSLIAPYIGNFRISSPFGERTHPITGKVTFHNGIDLAMPIGTELQAMSDGVIADIYENSAGGLQMLIDYNNGYRSGFAHLEKAIAKKGDKVVQGQLVALSGNTGQSTGPHLHLTLRKDGKLVNPQNYV